MPKENYDCGFEVKKADKKKPITIAVLIDDYYGKWFVYPYILVGTHNTGRIPENQLEKFEGRSVQEDIDKYQKLSSSLISALQVGKMYYDKQSKIAWLRLVLEEQVVNEGPIAGISGMVPTEKGFVQVVGYSLKDDYFKYESVFQSIIMSVAPEPWLVYKPK